MTSPLYLLQDTLADPSPSHLTLGLLFCLASVEQAHSPPLPIPVTQGVCELALHEAPRCLQAETVCWSPEGLVAQGTPCFIRVIIVINNTGAPVSSAFTFCFSGGSESAHNAGDPGSIPGSGRSPGEGSGNPLQFFCLENPMDEGAW